MAMQWTDSGAILDLYLLSFQAIGDSTQRALQITEIRLQLWQMLCDLQEQEKCSVLLRQIV